ncbi:MAG: hypothetical protein ACRDQ2_16200 [Gaiellales bacterium]
MTPRDREIVRWIGRHRMVTAGQVAEQFEIGRSQCYARLTGLVRLGLLVHERLLHGEPGVYRALRSGLDSAGLALPPASIDLRTYLHDLQLTSLVTELERAARAGARVWTERELRAIDTPGGRAPERYEPRFAALLGRGGQLRLTPAGSPRVHFPDAVIEDPIDGISAIELELTAKGRSRVRAILQAYVAARHISRVRYYVCDPRVGELLQGEITRLRAGDVVSLCPWDSEQPSARAA